MQKESRTYKAIIFDLDGTLIDSLPMHVESFVEVLKEKGLPLKKAVLQRRMGIPSSVIFNHLKKEYHLKDSLQRLRDERRAHFFKLLNKKNIIFPDAIKTLRILRKKYALAIATGSSKIVYMHSTSRQLRKLFDSVVVFEDVRKWKPAPDQFLLAAKRLRMSPRECLVVGDSIFDVIAARRAYMDCIAVTTGYHSALQLKKHGAIRVSNNLKELAEIL
jgi:HAD superfamily hydrolase (TIGR01509 family)